MHATLSPGLEKALHVINRLVHELDIHSAMRDVREVALELLDCERVTLFLVLGGNILRGKLPEPENTYVEVRFGEGIAGTVAQTGELVNIEDAYQHPLFVPINDKRTGFRTKQILCCSIHDHTGAIIAVLQALNTRSGQPFTTHDEAALKLFGVHLGSTLSKSKLHEQVKREKQRMATLSNCFKRLNAASSLPQVVSVISEAVQQLVYARHVFVFLADQARGELWLTMNGDSPAGYLSLRRKLGQGLLGSCGVQLKQVCMDLTADGPQDPLFEKLLPALDNQRPHSVLLQPIVEVRNTSRCIAVLMAVDKCSADYERDFFHEELFTQSDCDAMNVFAIEVGDILGDRSLEVSFASALSIVAANGCNSNRSQLGSMLKAQLMDYYSARPQADMERMASGSTPTSAALPTTPTSAALPTTPRLALADTARDDVRALRAPSAGMSYDMRTLTNWSLDFTELPSSELVKMAFDIFILSGVVAKLGIDEGRLSSFITAVASHYHDNPYHNFSHVLHVLHAVFMMLETTSAKAALSTADVLVLLLTALCHDLDHDGHTNSFQINSSSELAVRYNDVSVMENHHCAMTFAILRHKDCAILESLPAELQRNMRKLIIDCILATDLSNHFSLTHEFTKHSGEFRPGEAADRHLLAKVLLHAADISNQVRPFCVAAAMSERVQQEFANQAHKERAAGLPVAPHMEADTPELCAKMEVNFIDYIVLPLWRRLHEVFPELEPCLSNVEANRARYQEMALQMGAASEQASPRTSSSGAPPEGQPQCNQQGEQQQQGKQQEQQQQEGQPHQGQVMDTDDLPLAPSGLPQSSSSSSGGSHTTGASGAEAVQHTGSGPSSSSSSSSSSSRQGIRPNSPPRLSIEL